VDDVVGEIYDTPNLDGRSIALDGKYIRLGRQSERPLLADCVEEVGS
jgi:hypothetical protein